MLGIWILIRLDLDVFGQIRIIEKAVAVCGLIFQPPQSNWNASYSISAGFDNTDFTSSDVLLHGPLL
jgi:hypothetical protein